MELDDSNSQQESLYKTRSGRVVKPVKPLYVPDLNAVEDDFGSDEIDEELAFADDDGDSIHTSSEEDDEVEDERGNIIKIGRVPSELVNSSSKQSSTKRKRDDSDDDESEYQPGDSSELEEELHDSDYEQDVVSEVESDVECEDDVGTDDDSQDESQEESCSDDSEMDELVLMLTTGQWQFADRSFVRMQFHGYCIRVYPWWWCLISKKRL